MGLRSSLASLLNRLKTLVRMLPTIWKHIDVYEQVYSNWKRSPDMVISANHKIKFDLDRLNAFKDEVSIFDKLLRSAGRSALAVEDIFPCLDDRTSETPFDRHYIYHPAWAARVLAHSGVSEHVDVSSTLHFAAIVSAFVPVRFFDYRRAPLVLSNLNSGQADLLALPFESNSIRSLSCMHVLEHIGLGRYGDPYDIDGDRRAAKELSRVLAPSGQLLIVVPVGRGRIQFNAHRVYSHEDVLSLFDGLELVEVSLIPDGEAPDGIISHADPVLVSQQIYGCGCYLFKKK